MIKIKLGLLLLIMAGLTSCNTLKKQERKAEKFYYNHPEKLAQKAAGMFPNINEGITKGRVDTVRDIIRIQGAKGADGIAGEVRIIQTHSTDTLRIESGVKVAKQQIQIDELAAAFKILNKDLADYKDKFNGLQLEFKDMKESRNNWRLKFFALGGLIGGGVILKLFLKFKI